MLGQEGKTVGEGSFNRVSRVRAEDKNYALSSPKQAYKSALEEDDDAPTPAMIKANALLRRVRSPFVEPVLFMSPAQEKITPLGQQNLAEYLAALKESGQKLSADQAKRLIAQVALGVHSLHAADLVHGDLKPENILMFDQGFLQIIDTDGVAEVDSAGRRIDKELEALGTADFLSPEICTAVDHQRIMSNNPRAVAFAINQIIDRLRIADARAVDMFAYGKIIAEILEQTDAPHQALVELAASAQTPNPTTRPTAAEVVRSGYWGESTPEALAPYLENLTSQAQQAADTRHGTWYEHGPEVGSAFNIMPAPIQDLQMLYDKIQQQQAFIDDPASPVGIPELQALHRNLEAFLKSAKHLCKDRQYADYRDLLIIMATQAINIQRENHERVVPAAVEVICAAPDLNSLSFSQALQRQAVIASTLELLDAHISRSQKNEDDKQDIEHMYAIKVKLLTEDSDIQQRLSLAFPAAIASYTLQNPDPVSIAKADTHGKVSQPATNTLQERFTEKMLAGETAVELAQWLQTEMRQLSPAQAKVMTGCLDKAMSSAQFESEKVEEQEHQQEKEAPSYRLS